VVRVLIVEHGTFPVCARHFNALKKAARRS
jgi:hypothetical protein